MEDLTGRLHKKEKLLDRTHCQFRSHENREEAKAVGSASADVPAVGAQICWVKEGKKRKFSVASTKKKVEMKEEVEENKAARRSFEFKGELSATMQQHDGGHVVHLVVVLTKCDGGCIVVVS
jgi:hypothetical protein